MLTRQQEADRALFVRVGETLYGPAWHEPVARAVGVTGRSVRYWVAGRHAIPPGLWVELGELALTRREELGAVMEALERHIIARNKKEASS
jgi:hypothetical protein